MLAGTAATGFTQDEADCRCGLLVLAELQMLATCSLLKCNTIFLFFIDPSAHSAHPPIERHDRLFVYIADKKKKKRLLIMRREEFYKLPNVVLKQMLHISHKGISPALGNMTFLKREQLLD